MQPWNLTGRSTYIHHALQPRARRRVHGPLRPRRPGGDEPDEHHLLQRLLLLARQAVQGVHDPAWRRHRTDAAVRPVPAARRARPRPGAAAGRQLPRFLGARRPLRREEGASTTRPRPTSRSASGSSISSSSRAVSTRRPPRSVPWRRRCPTAASPTAASASSAATCPPQPSPRSARACRKPRSGTAPTSSSSSAW